MIEALERVFSLTMLGLLLAVGLIRIAFKLNGLVRRLKFVDKFSTELIGYMESTGMNAVRYQWLMENSERMQAESNSSISADHVINTHVADLRRGYTRQINGSSSRYADEQLKESEAKFVDELLRVRGFMKDRKAGLSMQLFNPAIWLREGVRWVIFFPVLLLEWFGFLSASQAERISEGKSATLITGLIAILGVLSSIFTVVLGWPEFKNRLLELVSW